MATEIKTIDWGKTVDERFSKALQASVYVMKRSLKEAVKHAIILMVQSAAKLTPKARKLREVKREGNVEYVEKNRKDSSVQKIYKWMFKRANNRYDMEAWRKARRIRNAGLASRSWKWGLKYLGQISDSKEMPNIIEVSEIKGDKVFGIVMKNTLRYIQKIMPAGWLKAVEAKTANRIIAQVEKKIARDAGREVQRAFNSGMSIGRGLL